MNNSGMNITNIGIVFGDIFESAGARFTIPQYYADISVDRPEPAPGHHSQRMTTVSRQRVRGKRYYPIRLGNI